MHVIMLSFYVSSTSKQLYLIKISQYILALFYDVFLNL